MSTGSATPAAAAPGPAPVTAAPRFASALRGELGLTRRRPAGWISLGIWAACIALFAYFVSYISTVGAQWYTVEQQDALVNSMLPQGTSYYVLASLPLYGAPQLAILGVILGASDFVRGTIGTISARFPARGPLIAARLVNLFIIGGAAAVVTLGTSVLSSVALAAVSGRSGAFPPPGELAVTLAAVWLVSVTFIGLGFAVGTLTRNLIAGVAVVAVWVLGVEALLVGVLAPVVPVLEGVQGFLPGGAASSLAAAFVPAGQQTVPALAAATGPGTAAGVLLVWAALAGGVSFVLLRRRDLT